MDLVWWGQRRGYEQQYVVQLLKGYLNKPQFPSLLSSFTKLQDLNLCINSQLNPFVDS